VKIYKVNTTSNLRLAEMGVIKDTVFRIVKRVAGMIQIKLKGSDLVLRGDTFKDIDYD